MRRTGVFWTGLILTGSALGAPKTQSPNTFIIFVSWAIWKRLLTLTQSREWGTPVSHLELLVEVVSGRAETLSPG